MELKVDKQKLDFAVTYAMEQMQGKSASIQVLQNLFNNAVIPSESPLGGGEQSPKPQGGE